ncbi:SWIM zinc finger family protein [Saccharopolyspora erythraea]|uniref:SWIM zinc finger family protein n=1 Tax=Saccharopolyspora erythraea TaxID=1836 RepID=UPI0020120E83|nr:SWIM zinc finger family protein [Saccharopolyspora erythraea]
MMNDRVRGFPAFGKGARRRSRSARTWWGDAWLRAVEDVALDPGQLVQGRRYACGGHVGPITVSPGRIAASVDGDHDTHRTSVSVEVLTDAEWSRLLDRVVARSGHIAALLDGEMPRELVESADDAGVRLLPGIGDLEPDCDCPGFEHPCRHAAALGHQVSWLLDADPFVLLLARGRGREELLAELRQRRACAEPDAPLLEPGELSRLADGAVARAARLLAEWDDADQLLDRFAG